MLCGADWDQVAHGHAGIRALKTLGDWPGVATAAAEEVEDRRAAYKAEIERAVARVEPEALAALAALATALTEHSA